MEQENKNIESLLQKLSVKLEKMSQPPDKILSYQEIRNLIITLPLLNQEISYWDEEKESIFNFKNFFSELFSHFFVPTLITILVIIFLLNYSYNISPKNIEVTFQIDSPQAKVVQIVGDFTKWKPVPLKKKNGLWIINLELKPGKYRYFYLIDGTPYIDPQKDVYEDPFGTKNSVIYI